MPATSIGEIGLDLVVNQGQFNKQMAGITGIAKKAGAALAGAFAVSKVVDFGKKCLELGSDLAEVQNVVDVTFPNMTAQVDKFAKSAAQSFGLSETMAKQYTGTFGAMAKAFGFSEKASYDMGTALTGLAGDVASFYNISQDEAYTKLKSVFTGETESLKDLGVVMTQTALDSYAMANGFGKTTSAMSEQEKVALRYKFVQDQLAASSGDFARTSGSWANQVRILKLQMQSFMATVGQGLINIFTPAIRVINILVGKLITLANAFKAFTELITGKKSSGATAQASSMASMGTAADDASSGLDNAADSADSATKSNNKVAQSAKKAAKELRSLMGFDKINKLNDNSSDSETSTDTPNTPTSGTATGSVLGNAMDFGKLAEGETVADKVDDKFTKMFKNILEYTEPTSEALKRLYNEGLSKLGKFTWGSLKDFYSGFLVPVGKWVMGKGLPEFINALNNGLTKVNYDKIRTALNNLWEALAPFAIKVGEGLLWFWKNVLVPLGTWTANEVVPRFLTTLSIAIKAVNSILTALQPLFQWFWDNVLQPIAKWTGGIFTTVWDKINTALEKFSKWCGDNPKAIQDAALAVAGFFVAWKTVELMAFVQMSGGVIGAIKSITAATLGATAAKIADKAETVYLTALYAKDFVVSAAQSASALAGQVTAFVASTAAKIADEAAQIALTAATVAWNAVCAIATTATTALGAAIAFLTSPIGIAVIAIGAIITAGVLLWKNWDTVKEKCAQLGNWIVDKTIALKDGAVEAFQTLVQNIKEAMKVMVDCVKEKWENAKTKFSEFSTWLHGVFTKDWSKDFGTLGKILNTFLKGVKDIWDGIKRVFNGIIEFVTGTFTGNWSRAWEGIKDIFGGIFDSLVDLAKTPINMIIDVVNGLLSSLNDGLSAIERAFTFNWGFTNPVTGTKHNWHFGMSLPRVSTIPHLAEGGFVKPNTPQLAMIGDNKHQGEVVAPEDKLKEMAMEAVRAAGGKGVTKDELESMLNRAVMRIVAALADMGFYLDSAQVNAAVRRAQQSMDIRYNTVEVV